MNVETLQTQYVDRVATMATDINKEVEVSVLLQRQVPQLMWKTAEVPRSQFLDRFAPPVISQVTKHVEISLFKYMHRTSPFPRFRRKSTR